MNRAVRATVLGMAAVTLALGFPREAEACSGGRMAEVGTPLDAADMIFTGTVVKRDEPFSYGMGITSSDTPIGWTFLVESIEQGPQLDRVRVESPLMDASCGIEFRFGQRYRVQAYDQGGTLSVMSGDATQLEPLPDGMRPPTEAGGLTFTFSLEIAALVAILLLVLVLVLVLVLAVWWRATGTRDVPARQD